MKGQRERGGRCLKLSRVDAEKAVKAIIFFKEKHFLQKMAEKVHANASTRIIQASVV